MASNGTAVERAVERTTVRLPRELQLKLRKLAEKTGAPHAHHFRKAVEAYLQKAER